MTENLDPHLEAAARACEFAQEVRAYHRHRTARNSKQRNADLTEARARVKKAMDPLRSYLGRAPYGPQTVAAGRLTNKVRRASASLQSERRKVWKMQQPQRRSEPV